MKRIMLLDDEENVLHSLQRGLRDISKQHELVFELFTVPAEAIKRLTQAQFSVVISDYHMPSMSGVDFLKFAKQIQPDVIRMMLSASADFNTLLEAINQAEVFRYIEKPWNINDLNDIVRLALVQYETNQAERELADETRLQNNQITPQQLEAQRLELEEPGITKVNWGADGSISLD